MALAHVLAPRSRGTIARVSDTSTPALRLLAPADAGRRALIRMASRLGLAKSVLASRERRVALGLSLAVASSLALAVTVPLHLLAIGPLVLGVPHLVADVRYLVLPTQIWRRGLAAVAIGAPLLGLALTRDLRWGMIAVLGAALVAPAAAGVARARVALARGLAVAMGLALLYCAHRARNETAFVLLHAHNLVAISWLFLLGPRRRSPWPLLATAAFALATAAIFGGAFDAVAFRLGTMDGVPRATSLDEQILLLAPPGASPREAVRWVLFFAFAQSVHYGVWLRVIPDQARPSATARSFAQSARVLVRQLGLPLCALAAALAVALGVYAAFAPHAARFLYLRVALFHGFLELAAFALVLVSGRALFAQPR